MNKKKKILIIVAAVLTLSVATGVTAFAAGPAITSGNSAVLDTSEQSVADTVDDQDNEENEPNITGSIVLGSEDESSDENNDKASEDQEDAMLANKAKISAAQAEEAVKAAFLTPKFLQLR